MPKLVLKAASSVKDVFERNVIVQEAVRAGKGFTLLISNEDMDGIIKILKSLEN